MQKGSGLLVTSTQHVDRVRESGTRSKCSRSLPGIQLWTGLINVVIAISLSHMDTHRRHYYVYEQDLEASSTSIRCVIHRGMMAVRCEHGTAKSRFALFHATKHRIDDVSKLKPLHSSSDAILTTQKRMTSYFQLIVYELLQLVTSSITQFVGEERERSAI